MEENVQSGSSRKILIGVLLLLLVGSIGLYFSDISLKSLIFGLSSQSGEKVGVVKAVTGKLKRQPKDSLEFIETSLNGDLFDEDTIMTGQEDRATIELFDGSLLELDPESLIRLSFDKTAGVDGIERRVLVDIVAGNVRGNIMDRPKLIVRRGGQPIARPSPVEINPVPDVSAPPSPEPSPEPSPIAAIVPDDLKVSQPKRGQVLAIPAGQMPPLKQPLVFTSPSRPTHEVLMVLKNGAGEEVLQKSAAAKDGKGGLLGTFERPGKYSLELRNLDGTPVGDGILIPFMVATDFIGIETQAPLVGGEPIDSNRFTGKRLQDFAVTLRWKALEDVEQYQVLAFNRDGKKLFNVNVKGTNFVLPQGKVTTDAVNYQIRAALPSGYVATSKKENFLFNFGSPTQTLPKNGDVISLNDPEVVKQKGIFLSWQRTTFTEAYEFEIALDPQFVKVFKRVTLKQQDNFLIFRNLKPRDYWWRVRAIAGDVKSPAGLGFKITVTP